MKITRIGIDLAKQVFQLHGVDVHEPCSPVGRVGFINPRGSVSN